MHLITGDAKNFHCRPMWGILSGNTIYAATSRKSRKVSQIKSSGRAAFYVYDPKTQNYACISGTAELGVERKWRLKVWHKPMQDYFPGGVDDKDLIYIKLKVEKVDYVSWT
jgi:general stress protein 26